VLSNHLKCADRRDRALLQRKAYRHHRARGCVAEIVMSVASMVNPISTGYGGAAFQRGELTNQLFVIDKPCSARSEQRQGLDINRGSIKSFFTGAADCTTVYCPSSPAIG
jgi:hypothetical protein